VGAAMTVGPPPILEDAAFRIRAGDSWRIEIAPRLCKALGRATLSGEDELYF